MTLLREKPETAYRPAKNLRRPDKKKHILQVMESITESGAGAMTALHIADRAGYADSPSFRDLLWELVDEQEIYADQKAYYGGVCQVRWLFYLPEVWRTKQAVKKMRARDRA